MASQAQEMEMIFPLPLAPAFSLAISLSLWHVLVIIQTINKCVCVVVDSDHWLICIHIPQSH